jgi:hypothetical protein
MAILLSSFEKRGDINVDEYTFDLKKKGIEDAKARYFKTSYCLYTSTCKFLPKLFWTREYI